MLRALLAACCVLSQVYTQPSSLLFRLLVVDGYSGWLQGFRCLPSSVSAASTGAAPVLLLLPAAAAIGGLDARESHPTQ
jgi:hypothetical protein